MLLADYHGVQGVGGGGQRVDGRVQAELGDGAGQRRRGVQVDERRGRRRVRQVVCGDVDGLDRGDGAALGRGDALLQVAHLGGQRRLVTDCRGHTAEQGRDLGARLGEAEDVVDEEQNVLALVAEVLGGGQAGQTDAQTGSRGLVHLTVNHAGLLDDAGLAHLQIEVGALTGALADASEHGGAAVTKSQIVDELLNQNGLADAGAAEQARLAATNVGLEQVDCLDAGLENLRGGRELLKGRRRMVDWVEALHLGHGLFVDGLTHDVPDAAEDVGADRHLHGRARVDGLIAALQAVRRRHSNGTNDAAGTVLLNLEHRREVADG